MFPEMHDPRPDWSDRESFSIEEELERTLRDIEFHRGEYPLFRDESGHEHRLERSEEPGSSSWLRIATCGAAIGMAVMLSLTPHAQKAPVAPSEETKKPKEELPKSDEKKPTRPDVAPKPKTIKEACTQNLDKYAVILAGAATGSGSVIDSAGVLVTNHHVVAEAGRGGELTVKFLNGTTLPGKVVALDRKNDLALIKINPQAPLTPIEIAGLKEGLRQKVCAIGTPFGKPGQISVGETKEKPDSANVVTTAQLAPGYSGGPLLDEAGKLVGVNKEIEADSPDDNWGNGVATRSELVTKLLKQYQSREENGI